MTTPVAIVQMGLGLWGLDWARRVVPEVRNVETVAWVDPAAEARAMAVDKLGLPAERCFASLAEAVDVAAPEAVLGTVALAAHAPVITEALEHGLHVLIEKPFAPSAGEAQQLAAAAARADRILHVSRTTVSIRQ